MALPATLVCECRSGANDLNGGGYDSAAVGGTDRSQQDAPHVTIDGVTITAIVQATTTQLLIAGYTTLTGDIGNIVNITGGTATAGRYHITAVNTGTNIWTMDRAVGTAAQTATGRMGGAVKFLGALTNTTGTTLVSGNIVWIKNDGAYALTTSTPGNGGPASIGNIGTRIEGYQTTRGDRGLPPVISAGAQTGVTIIASAGTNNVFTVINVAVDGNNGATNNGYAGGNRPFFFHCEALNCPGSGFLTLLPRCTNCYAENCGIGFDSAFSVGCVAKSCGTGFSCNAANSSASDCIAYSCSGDGFLCAVGAIVDNCSSWGNGGDGFDMTAVTTCAATNCVAVNNTGYGYNTPATVAGQQGIRMVNNAAYNNTAGNLSNAVQFNDSPLILTGEPFTNPAGGDFSSNATSGAGGALRAAGLDPYHQTGYQDIGAVQHGDPGGGGGGGGGGASGRFSTSRFGIVGRI